MARASANFLLQAAALARMSGFSPTSAADLGLGADDLANVLLDLNQGYEEAYNWQNTSWEDAWTSGTLTPGVNGLLTFDQIQDAAQFTIWDSDPRTNAAAHPLVFRSSDAGLHIPSWTGAVFAFWKPAAPVFTFEAWSGVMAYAAGRIVLATDGQCYRALQAGTNQSPLTQTAYWRVQPLLAVLMKAAQKMALANKATRDGNHGEAAKMVKDAGSKLDDQAELEFPRVSSWWWIRRQ